MPNRVRAGVVGAVTIALAAAAAGAQQPGTAAVTSTLLQDVQALAERDVPFGVVLGKDDAIGMQVWRAPRSAGAAQSRDAVAANFRSDWRERFWISSGGRVLSAISTRVTLCAPALERTVAPRTVTGTPVEVLFAVMRELDASLRQLPPPGVVSGGGSPSASAVFASVNVDVPAGTLHRALDAIVSSTHQLGWIATERCTGVPRCHCDLGFVTPKDMVYTSYDAAAGTGGPH